MLATDKKSQVEGMPTKLYGRHSLESYGYRLGEYKGNFGETSDWLESVSYTHLTLPTTPYV